MSRSFPADITEDEAALYMHCQMFGSEGYPIHKVRGGWLLGPFREWKGFPKVFKTKKAAAEQFERWMDLFRERWRDLKREHPHAILTAVGVRLNDQLSDHQADEAFHQWDRYHWPLRKP